MRMWQLIAKKNHDLLSNTTRLQTPPATLEVTRSAALVLDAYKHRSNGVRHYQTRLRWNHERRMILRMPKYLLALTILAA